MGLANFSMRMEALTKVNGRMGKYKDMEDYTINLVTQPMKDTGVKENLMVKEKLLTKNPKRLREALTLKTLHKQVVHG